MAAFENYMQLFVPQELAADKEPDQNYEICLNKLLPVCYGSGLKNSAQVFMFIYNVETCLSLYFAVLECS